MEWEKKFNGAALMSTESRQPLNIPLNYPHGCADKQILLTLQTISTELLMRGASAWKAELLEWRLDRRRRFA